MVAGFAAFLGHLFPVWLRFRGGKGVATFLGVMLALAWPAGLAACATWLAVAFATRYSSLAARSSARRRDPLWLAGRFGRADAGLARRRAGGAVVFIRHHANIRRLLDGERSARAEPVGTGRARLSRPA